MGRVAKLKLQYFGHITRGSAGQLALRPTVLEGIMEGLQHQGRSRRQWTHDIEEWTGCEYIQLKKMSQDRAQWNNALIAHPTDITEVWRAGVQCCWSCSLEHPSHRHPDNHQHSSFQEETENFSLC